MISTFLSIYLIGCAISAILVMILHVIEYYEGLPIQLGEQLFLTLICIGSSWLFSVFAAVHILGYIFDKLQNITIVRKK